MEPLNEQFERALLKLLNRRLLDNQEFMQMMKISPRTAQNWRDKNLVPYHMIGKKIYYRMEEINDVLNQNKVESHVR